MESENGFVYLTQSNHPMHDMNKWESVQTESTNESLKSSVLFPLQYFLKPPRVIQKYDINNELLIGSKHYRKRNDSKGYEDYIKTLNSRTLIKKRLEKITTDAEHHQRMDMIRKNNQINANKRKIIQRRQDKKYIERQAKINILRTSLSEFTVMKTEGVNS
jgi:hypothetical protein